MRPWQFRQKTPGFGISKDFYITVLAATAQLPSILEVVEPHGAFGAIEGFGVPLSRDKQKEDLTRPMERGVYGLATRNRETVLRLVVIPKEEAGFDPAPFLRSAAPIFSAALSTNSIENRPSGPEGVGTMMNVRSVARIASS